MNSSNRSYNQTLKWWLAALLVVGLGTLAARGESGRADTQRAASNAAPAAITIPKSVFVIPTSTEQGTDPFFPKAAVSPHVETTPRDPRPSITGELHLKGISGTAQQRLAIINNYTLAAGDEAELNLGTGRVRIRCLEITADAVVIEIGGERRELRMRQGL